MGTSFELKPGRYNTRENRERRALGKRTARGWPMRRMSSRDVGSFLCGRFQHGEDISGGIFEPGDGWAVAAKNSAGVGFQIGLVIDFEANTAAAEFIDGFFDA